MNSKYKIILKVVALIFCIILILANRPSPPKPITYTPYSPDVEKGIYCEANVTGLIPIGTEGRALGSAYITNFYYCLALLEDGSVGLVKVDAQYPDYTIKYPELVIENLASPSDQVVVLRGKTTDMPRLSINIMDKTGSMSDDYSAFYDEILSEEKATNQKLNNITLLNTELYPEEENVTNSKISDYATIAAVILCFLLIKDLVVFLANKKMQKGAYYGYNR